MKGVILAGDSGDKLFPLSLGVLLHLTVPIMVFIFLKDCGEK